MITNEEYEEFLTTIDDSIKTIIKQDVLDDSKWNIQCCVDAFCEIKFGKRLPTIWVKQGNLPISEFYPSEHHLSWLATYIKFYSTFLRGTGDVDGDLDRTYKTCIFLSLILTMVSGINIVDETVYLLEKDCNFVQYSLDMKPMGKLFI
jgi:hypothetical protein